MTTSDIIERYNELRRFCYDLARSNNGKLMGADAWLCFAMDERDITLGWAGSDGVWCSGYCFTTQTQSTEYFEFTIPWELIPDDLKD